MSGVRRKARNPGNRNAATRHPIGPLGDSPAAPFRKRSVRDGIKHKGNGTVVSAERPPTEAQLEVWRALDPKHPRTATMIGERIGAPRGGVTARLVALKQKGLAEQGGYRGGWLKRG